MLTGRKREQKVYYHHTGYIGGIKERTAQLDLEGRFPERVVEKAVRAHAAARPARPSAASAICASTRVPSIRTRRSSPKSLDIAKMNRKNTRSA